MSYKTCAICNDMLQLAALNNRHNGWQPVMLRIEDHAGNPLRHFIFGGASATICDRPVAGMKTLREHMGRPVFGDETVGLGEPSFPRRDDDASA